MNVSVFSDQKVTACEPCSLSDSVEDINIWRQGLQTPEDLFSLPDSQTCSSPEVLFLDTMAAQSSSGNGLETFYSFAPDVHNLLEQDTYPSFPEGGQTRPGSLPSLDFASSAYVESHSSTGACSPVHYEMSYSNEIYGPPQHADVMNPTNVSAPNDIGSVPCPSLHLPGCPSAAPYHHPPHLQSLIPHGPPPMTACAHAYDPRHAIEAWQSAQHSQRNQASYCPQHHPRVTHSTVLQSQGTNAQCSHDSQGISSQAQEQRQAWTSEAVQKQSSS